MILIMAYLFMIVSHVGVYLFKNNYYMIIGLPVIPVFSYLIAQGSRYTRDHTKYIFRIILIGVISEPFFRYMTGESFNDIFCYSVGLAFIHSFRNENDLTWKSFYMLGVLFMFYFVSFRLMYVCLWVFLFDCIYDLFKQPVKPIFKRSYLNYVIYPVHLVAVDALKYFF